MTQHHTTEAAAIAALAQEIKVVDVEYVPHAMIPPGHSLQSLEKLMDAPMRIRASPEFTAAEDFSIYFKEFAEEGTRIFVDDDKYRFTSVFDFHTPGSPAHGDHSAGLQMSLASEWRRWKDWSGRRMNREQFANFLENNLDYIVGDFAGTKLLQMCRSLKVRTRGDLQADERMADGQRSLVFKTDSEVRGQLADGMEVAFPEIIQVRIRVFKNAATYDLPARLRWSVSPKDGAEFWYDLMDPEGVEEAAFGKVIEQVTELCERRPIRGKYEGKYHK